MSKKTIGMVDGLEVGSPLSIGFESGRLSYSDAEVDLYNSGVNSILSAAASRGHGLVHFRAADVFDSDGVPYAKVSVLEDPNPGEGDGPEVYRRLRKVGEKEMPLSELHIAFTRADDITPFTPGIEILERAEADTIFLESMQDTLDTCDKYELVARRPDIPSPVTYAADDMEKAIEAVQRVPKHEGRFVLKDRYGYGCGTSVHLLHENQPDLHGNLSAWIKDYGHIIVQEFCPEVAQGDLVVTFFDDEMLGAMQRVARNGEWKTNASLGARELAYELSDRQLGIAKDVAGTFPGCRFASVDMLPTGKVLEINAFPGGSGLYRLYGVSVGAVVMDKLETEAYARFGKRQNHNKSDIPNPNEDIRGLPLTA